MKKNIDTIFLKRIWEELTQTKGTKDELEHQIFHDSFNMVSFILVLLPKTNEKVAQLKAIA